MLIALSGILANILLGTFLKQINIWFFANASATLHTYFVFNLAFAAWNMLPIPPLDGSRIIFDSRLVYAFLFGSFVGYAILAWLQIYSFIFALIIGVLVWLTFYIRVERK
jgi:Zn-dependent protease